MREEISSELDRLYEKAGQKLSASIVLNEARSEASPLHKEFDWDDSSAAEKYRLVQARTLVKRYNVKIEVSDQALVHVRPLLGRGEGTYRRVRHVVQSQSEYERALAEALKTLEAAKRNLDLLRSSTTSDDKLAAISVSLEALSTANVALRSLH